MYSAIKYTNIIIPNVVKEKDIDFAFIKNPVKGIRMKIPKLLNILLIESIVAL